MTGFLRKQRGHSFIELVLVISLVGILGVYAMPRDDGNAAITLDAASRKLLGDMRYAQSLAMTTSVSHGVRGLGATLYEVYNVDTNTAVNSPFHQTPMQEDLSDDFNITQFQNGNFNIVFDATGRPTVGGGTAVQLNHSGQSKSVQVTANSGHISII